MPKRSAEEKLFHYEQKIRKLKDKVKKKRRILIRPLDSDGENIEETNDGDPYVDAVVDELPEQLEDTLESQTNVFPSASPPLPPSSPLPHVVSDTVLEQTNHEDEQITTAPVTETSPEVTEPPLDPLLLSALGACTSDTPDFGENVHNSLANLWLPLLRKGLSKEDKDNLTKQYLIPANCKLLQAPKLNAEISAAVSDVVRGRDKKLTGFQQELGAGLSAINRGMDIMLKNDNKALALKNLSDGCRLLSNLHYCFTKDRTKLITPSLDKSVLHVIQDTERDDTLFGNSLAEKIKACKAIEKQGHQIRNKTKQQNAAPQTSASRPAQPGNWAGPPRYLSARGGRGGRGRAASTAPRRPYPTTVTQTSTRSSNSNQSKTRANAQH